MVIDKEYKEILKSQIKKYASEIKRFNEEINLYYSSKQDIFYSYNNDEYDDHSFKVLSVSADKYINRFKALIAVYTCSKQIAELDLEELNYLETLDVYNMTKKQEREFSKKELIYEASVFAYKMARDKTLEELNKEMDQYRKIDEEIYKIEKEQEKLEQEEYGKASVTKITCKKYDKYRIKIKQKREQRYSNKEI